MKKTLALLTVMSAFATAPAFAETVEFNGTVSSSCTFSGVTNGTLAANAAVNQMDSTLGTSGSFDISANASIFSLSVSDPSGWSTDPGAVPPTSFTASATLDGSTAYDGTSIGVPVGTFSGSVDLAASTTDPSDTFPNGGYTAIVTITCS